MKQKKILHDLKIAIDPKPLTKKEEIALSKFIKELKSKAKSKKRIAAEITCTRKQLPLVPCQAEPFEAFAW